MSSLTHVFLSYICPSLGGLLSNFMFAAPIQDLRQALATAGKTGVHSAHTEQTQEHLNTQTQEHLNTYPWPFMTGNCLGWTAYAYYTRDPFILAANLPGFVLSLWLNMGAAKLQYHAAAVAQQAQHHPIISRDWAAADASSPVDDETDEQGEGSNHSTSTSRLVGGNDSADLIFVPQEVLLLRILSVWSVVLVAVGWALPAVSSNFTLQNATVSVGLLVQTNLIVFLGAPLSTVRTVVTTGSSVSIHRPTMYMNWLNCTFWILYGLVRLDVMIVFPNAMGLALGVAQGCLCVLYPMSTVSVLHEQQQVDTEDEANDVAGMESHPFSIT